MKKNLFIAYLAVFVAMLLGLNGCGFKQKSELKAPTKSTKVLPLDKILGTYLIKDESAADGWGSKTFYQVPYVITFTPEEKTANRVRDPKEVFLYINYILSKKGEKSSPARRGTSVLLPKAQFQRGRAIAGLSSREVTKDRQEPNKIIIENNAVISEGKEEKEQNFKANILLQYTFVSEKELKFKLKVDFDEGFTQRAEDLFQTKNLYAGIHRREIEVTYLKIERLPDEFTKNELEEISEE